MSENLESLDRPFERLNEQRNSERIMRLQSQLAAAEERK